MKKLCLLTCLICISCLTYAQETFPVNGVQDKRPQIFAFTHANIVVGADKTIENATLLIEKGKIKAVGKNVGLPDGALVTDLKGKYIYPSFIDLYSSYGLPDPKNGNGRGGRPQFISQKPGAYSWNEAIHPEYLANKHFTANAGDAEKFRKMGFGAVLSHNKDGIARGTSVLVSLGDKRDNELILNESPGAHYSFKKGSSGNDYPSSLMGSIALLRQTGYDAQWYKNGGNKQQQNFSLEAFNQQQNLPQFFETDNVLDILRADKLGDEFGKQFIFKGNGDSYQRLQKVKSTGGTLIVPMNFPDAYDVEDPFDALQVSLRQMKHWELAPSNPARLEKADIRFALTADGAEKDFWKNLRKAIDFGLSPEQALRSLTVIPAQLIGAENELGTLEVGKLANFIITSGNIFDKDNIIYENWVQGQKFTVNSLDFPDIRGEYDLKIDGLEALQITITGTAIKPSVKIKADTTDTKAEYSRSGDLFTLVFELENITNGKVRLTGHVKSEQPLTLSGRGTLANGQAAQWHANYTGEAEKKEKKEEEDENYVLSPITYPFTAFGWTRKPEQQKVLIQNATVWTNEAEGILENADVLINNGKIVAVGENLNAGGAKVIDGTGKHLTPGIIDEHSHIAATRGINEGTQAVSAEVRIGDVINSEDVNIYRQLAGGVTTSHILHGSANPIGGQTQLLKLRWGAAPEELKFEGWGGFIKFALGENVKQSNWGSDNTIRFPQTRMGVEQVMVDAFQRAKEYEKAMASDENTRRDLELDALVEILSEKRFITCHSYVQSEISMLMYVADSMGFKVNTFTHILEGYKVADEMKEHGAAGSTFSDWWAYKMEVQDAIPYNAAIMHNVGIVTGINSDDAEMARRLNQEAAKTVKYGGLSEEEALKLVTLNPAKMLHIDDQVGSLKAGKDADIVLWNDNPLSVYAKPLKTFVDGIPYFDIERDAQMREQVKAERARLIQEMLEEKKNGKRTQKPKKEEKILYDCEDMFHFGGGFDDEAYNRSFTSQHSAH